MLSKTTVSTWLRSIFLIGLVTFLYTITGYFGLYFAIPPGYATAIWIPSGIALGAALVWGLRILPGIFLGSFLTNVFVTTRIEFDYSLYMYILVGLIIAIGALLQVMVALLLIKKWVGLKNPLLYPNDILLFALLAGPIACLVNAAYSNTALLLLHFPTAHYLLNFGTWWIGDSMGVLLITPIFLILFAKPIDIWRQRILPILFPLCMSFMIVIFVFVIVSAAEVKRIQGIFEHFLENQILQVENTLSKMHRPLSNIALYQLINSNLIKKNYYSINIINNEEKASIYSFKNDYFHPPTGKYYFILKKQVNIQNKEWLVNASPTLYFVNTEYSWQLWFLLCSGLLFCVLINITLFILYGQKVISQRGMEKHKIAFEKAELKNLLILRAAGEGIIGVNKQKVITFINPAAEKMLGYEDTELLGKSIHLFMNLQNTKEKRCAIDATLKYSKIYQASDEKFFRKNNTFFWVEYTSTPLQNQGKTAGAVIVFNDITERRAMNAELEHMAHYDILTGLPNRASFFEHLSLVVSSSEKTKNHFAICFIDLDNFKQINDNLGHSAGDETLKNVAYLLQSSLRESDFLARLGGDEFAIILQDILSPQDIITALKRIKNKMEKPIIISGHPIKVSISIGISIYPTTSTEPEELVKKADIAMYRAKEAGKNTYAFFDP